MVSLDFFFFLGNLCTSNKKGETDSAFNVDRKTVFSKSTYHFRNSFNKKQRFIQQISL